MWSFIGCFERNPLYYPAWIGSHKQDIKLTKGVLRNGQEKTVKHQKHLVFFALNKPMTANPDLLMILKDIIRIPLHQSGISRF